MLNHCKFHALSPPCFLIGHVARLLMFDFHDNSMNRIYSKSIRLHNKTYTCQIKIYASLYKR